MILKTSVRTPDQKLVLPTGALGEVWRGIWVISYREFLRFSRERSRWIASMVWPIVLLSVLGVGFNRVIGDLAPDLSYIEFLIPGFIAISVAGSSLAAGLSVVWDREFGFLREVLVAPVSRTGIVLGKALGGAVVATLQGMIIVIFAPLVGVPVTIPSLLQLVPLFVILSLFLGCLGVLLATLIRSQRAFGVIRQAVQFPLVLLSGAFFPVDVLPIWLQIASKINPLTYGVDATRQVFWGANLSAGRFFFEESYGLGISVFGHTMGVFEDLVVLIGLGLVIVVAAVWSFGRQEIV